jgi:hypothetical protein
MVRYPRSLSSAPGGTGCSVRSNLEGTPTLGVSFLNSDPITLGGTRSKLSPRARASHLDS